MILICAIRSVKVWPRTVFYLCIMAKLKFVCNNVQRLHLCLRRWKWYCTATGSAEPRYSASSWQVCAGLHSFAVSYRRLRWFCHRPFDYIKPCEFYCCSHLTKRLMSAACKWLYCRVSYLSYPICLYPLRGIAYIFRKLNMVWLSFLLCQVAGRP